MRNPRMLPNRGKPRDPIADSIVSNYQISSKTVRLIDHTGKNLGEISTVVAIKMAAEQGLDLVVVAGDAQPPVTKMMDVKKHIYDLKQAKKEHDRQARKNTVHVKEIQLRPVTDNHDLTIKREHAQQFLNEHNKVKVVMKFRGREVHHAQRGLQMIREFIDALGDCKVEKNPELQGHNITAIICPQKKIDNVH